MTVKCSSSKESLTSPQYFGASDHVLACGGGGSGAVGHVASQHQLRQMVVQQDLLSGQAVGSGAVVAK